MRILIFGGGDLAQEIANTASIWPSVSVEILDRVECDATDYDAVINECEYRQPDAVICTAGLSDIAADTLEEVINANLVTAINVGTAALSVGAKCVLIASTAGMAPGEHVWYGPAKAGVINFVEAMANGGAKIWAVSPGRMDTRMRQADFPEEDPATRLRPRKVASVVIDVLEGQYKPGANVVVRKVGIDGRVDTYEAPKVVLPSGLSE